MPVHLSPVYARRRAPLMLAVVLALFTLPPARALDDWTPTAGPEGGAVLAYASLDGVLLAGTRGGIFRSFDEGQSWSGPLPDFPLGQVVSSMGVSNGDIFTATFGAGVFRSDDLGDTWLDVSSGLPFPRVTHTFVDGDAVYVISDTVPMRTTDRGRSWERIVLPFSDGATSIYAEGELILAGSNLAVGVHRSTDGGRSWDTHNMGGTTHVEAMVRVPGGPLVAGTSHIGLYRSDDDGQSWTLISEDLGRQPQTHALFHHNGVTYLGAATELHGFFALYRTFDIGENWELMRKGAPRELEAFSWTFGAIGDTVLLGAEGGAWRSTDQGESWKEASSGLTTTYLRALSSVGGRLFANVSNMRRVFRTDDGGETWTSSGEGFTRDARTEGLLAVNEERVFTGTDRVGAFRSDDGGQTWIEINNGLPEFNGTAGLQFRRMANFGRQGDAIYVATGIDLEFITGQQRFENTGAGVFKTTDNGQTWQPARQGLPIITFDSFGEPKFDPILGFGAFDDVLLAGTFRRGVFRSVDGGRSWREANQGLPRDPILPPMTAFVEFDGEIFAAAGPFGGDQATVFRSADRGLSWEESANGLPRVTQVNALVVAGCGTMYAAVNDNAGSLFVSTDSGRSWQPTDGDLAGWRTNALAAAPGVVYAGTAGLGVWRSGAGVACEAIHKLKTRCNGGRLTAKVKSSLPPGTTLTLTRDGKEPRAIRINNKGRGKTVWLNQSGRNNVCVCECPGVCRKAQCP